MEQNTSDIYVDPFIYSGSAVMQGSGYVLVLAVGSNTHIHRIL